MKTIYTLFLSCLFFSAAASEEELKMIVFNKYKVDTVKTFASSEAEFVFEVNDLRPEEKGLEIRYSIDQIEFKTTLKDGSFRVKTTPGDHTFQIYLSSDFQEMYSSPLTIGARERHYYKLNPWRSDVYIIVDKPVIYLYPETEEEFEVEVKPTGTFTFTYPAYKDGWKGTMHPNGDLDIGGESYRYLFWESKQNLTPFDANAEGFVLSKVDLTNFLESTLNTVGFTSEERADFLTFWAPRMIQYEQVFVHFHQDADCDQFAELNITPTPDNTHRFYMSWAPIEGSSTPTPQVLVPFNRAGFTAIEWGGQQLNTINKPEL